MMPCAGALSVLPSLHIDEIVKRSDLLIQTILSLYLSLKGDPACPGGGRGRFCPSLILPPMGSAAPSRQGRHWRAPAGPETGRLDVGWMSVVLVAY